MRPQDYPIDLQKLKAFWRAFMLDKVKHPVEAQDPLIFESWNRCLLRHNPTASAQIVKAKDSHLQTNLTLQSDWLMVATPYLEDLREQIASAEHLLLLTDRTGCLLSIQQQPGSSIFERFPEIEIGTYWQEIRMGTNALGLSLITAMPTQVVGAEHFFETYHDLVSTAAPVHNEEGRLIGLVGMIGPIDTANSRDLAFVSSTAHAISNILQTNQFLEDSNQQLTQVHAILETISEGVLMWDSLSRIKHCNSQVAKMFGVSLSSLSGKFVEQVIEFQPQIKIAIEREEIVQNVETTVQIENRRIPCLLTLKPVTVGQGVVIGWMAMLQPMTQVRQIVQQHFGTKAAFTFDDFVVDSASMKKVVQQAQGAAKGTAPILLEGEGGVGKKRLGQAIHNSGPRSRRPFVIFNCRAIPRELMIRDLLGIENENETPGRPSKLELADGGTLLIEYIEDLPLSMQEVLLNFIDMRHIARVGGSRMIALNVRIICTTSVDLGQRVQEKSFSPQLYYRLKAFHFIIPPLRQRREDIPGIIERYTTLRQSTQSSPLTLEPDAAQALRQYPWPGNVRELENILERAFSQAEQNRISLPHLPESVRFGRVLAGENPDPQPVMTLKEAEREAIVRAGWAHKGAVSKMAEELDIGRTTLWRKMRELNISPEQFK